MHRAAERYFIGRAPINKPHKPDGRASRYLIGRNIWNLYSTVRQVYESPTRIPSEPADVPQWSYRPNARHSEMPSRQLALQYCKYRMTFREMSLYARRL